MIEKQLTRNFFRSEFACPCCDKALVDSKFVAALQQLRDICGYPIRVLSGYRCKSHNIKVGGRERSFHLHGRAADIQIGELSVPEMLELVDAISEFHEGGIGIYDSGFVHVDNRRWKQARWGRIDGKYVGLEEALKAIVRGAED